MTGEVYTQFGEEADGVEVNKLRANRALVEAVALLYLLEAEESIQGQVPDADI